jgi:bifunctional non-homologous end joining protein LigD
MLEVEEKLVSLTNLEKIYWPEKGYTKGDLIKYYMAVARPLLIFLKDRPLTLNRYPNGISGQSFYQKKCPASAPEWIKRFEGYIVCNDAATLLYVVNSGSIELHPWMTKINAPDTPDLAVIDLDPDPPSGFAEAVKVAEVMRILLEKLELKSAIKTSGATGLHIYVPLKPVYTYEEVTKFVGYLGSLVVKAMPELATNERLIRNRHGKIYIDHLQNAKGKTIASVFSARPVPGGTVSTPISWEQLHSIDPASFTIKKIPELLESGSVADFTWILADSAGQLIPGNINN